MQKHIHRVAAFVGLAISWMIAAPALGQPAGTVEQVIELKPGWNAIYLRVEPTNRDIRSVFSNLPIASIWRWIPDETGAEFVEDPAEGLENIDGWFAWFPEPRPEAFLSNLYRIDPNTAYLVEVEGNESHEIAIEGRPKHRSQHWESDAFTLTGLPVSEIAPPTFEEYFETSNAHIGQPVYRLDPDGTWHEVDKSSTAIRDGEAYWIHTRGNSRFQGKMGLILDQGDSLEYSAALTEVTFVLRNRSGRDSSFMIRRLNGTTLPMAYLYEDPETGQSDWPFLQNQLVVPAPEGENLQMTFAVLREQFGRSRMEQVFEITDESGQRILLHAGGNTIQPISEAATERSKGSKTMRNDAGLMDSHDEIVSYAGLWVGSIKIDAVSESQQGGVEPTPVRDAFSQRVIIHVDSSGQARLLKDVIQMWEDGTTAPSSIDPDLNEVEEPGRYVLLTDKSLIALYSGAVNRGGRQVGLRYSTVAYDFPDIEQEFSGAFGPGEQLSTTLVVDPEMPTNPFQHRFHPDHDNLDAQFLNFEQEAYQVTRDIRLVFTTEDPEGREPPGWGDSLLGGEFEGAISGLHRNTIFTSGTFRLRRVSAVPVLNQ